MEKSENPSSGATVVLVRAAQSGDRQAVEQLFARYLPRVRQIVALRLGPRLRQVVDVEDVVQEALLRVFESMDDFAERSEGNFLNWVSRCVEHEIASQARKFRAQKRGGGKVVRFSDRPSKTAQGTSMFMGRGPTPSAIVQGQELEERILMVLLGMPKVYREALILRHLCAMSYSEVAKTLGFRSEATARKACSRAVSKLNELVRG